MAQQPPQGWGPPAQQQPSPQGWAPQQQPTQPGWGPPPQQPPKPRKPWYKRPIIMLPLVVVVLIIVGSVAGGGGNTTSSSAPTTAAPAANTQPPQSADIQTPTTSPPTPSGPSTAHLGEAVSFADSFGKHSADITVVRKKVSTGSGFENPNNGRYVGLFVRVKAFQDGISVPSFYALEQGKHYDSTCCTTGFTPELSALSNLNQGETAEGWVLFDVPAASGKLVMQEFASEKAQATWLF
jgi:hypothetical protein